MFVEFPAVVLNEGLFKMHFKSRVNQEDRGRGKGNAVCYSAAEPTHGPGGVLGEAKLVIYLINTHP